MTNFASDALNLFLVTTTRSKYANGKMTWNAATKPITYANAALNNSHAVNRKSGLTPPTRTATPSC